jgi:hypothetical protein
MGPVLSNTWCEPSAWDKHLEVYKPHESGNCDHFTVTFRGDMACFNRPKAFTNDTLPGTVVATKKSSERVVFVGQAPALNSHRSQSTQFSRYD